MEQNDGIVSSILSWPAPFHRVGPPLSSFLHSLKRSHKIRPRAAEEEAEEDEEEDQGVAVGADEVDDQGLDCSAPPFRLLLPSRFSSLRPRNRNRKSFLSGLPRWPVQTREEPSFRPDDDALHESLGFTLNLEGNEAVKALKTGFIGRDEGEGRAEALESGNDSRNGHGKDMDYSQKLEDVYQYKDRADIRDSDTLSMISSIGVKGNIDTLQKIDTKEASSDIRASINQSMDLPSSGPVSKEQIGRATWTFLHTLAAQFPNKPTRQQQRDAKELMAIISRLYPCKECADHFKEILKANPVQAGSGIEFAQWMCRVHNIINRSLQKPMFLCQRVDARWGALHCDNDACNLQGRMRHK